MKRIFIAASLAFAATLSFALPARQGVWRILKLANGTEVRASLQGDEFCHYWQAADGSTYVEAADGTYYVAADKAALTKVGNELRAKAYSAQAAYAAKAPKAKATAGTTGDKKALLILVSFPDKPFSEGVTRDYFDRIANEENFNDGDFKGSVHDYFKAQSMGKLNLSFDVVGPVEMPDRYRYYGANLGGTQGNDAHIGEMIYNACQGVDGEVDFSKYDWDGDGKMDQVVVVYAGQGEAAGGDANTIWPQEGYLSAQLSDQEPFTLDGVTIDKFAVSCELGLSGKLDGIGTLCHEFSHCFGLPDFYDRSGSMLGGSNYGMSVYSLMDYGNYMGNSFLPVHYTSYEQMFCGWKQPIVLKNDTTVTNMKPLSEGGDAYIIYNDAHPDEYFLLENRQPTGWDAGLFGGGLLIIHVDYSKETWDANQVNSSARQRCTVVHADNSAVRYYVELNNESEVVGDLYPWNANNALTNTSTPAAALNNDNGSNGKLLGKSVTNITRNADGTIGFKFWASPVSGITSVNTVPAAKAKAFYTIDGRYAGQDKEALAPGLYLQNGRKVIIDAKY